MVVNQIIKEKNTLDKPIKKTSMNLSHLYGDLLCCYYFSISIIPVYFSHEVIK